MATLAIMGGTFDPIHYGHLMAAEQVRYRFNCDQVLFMPAARSPHKTAVVMSPAKHRLAMTRLAVVSNHRFEVSTLEIDRAGLSYTIDTIKIIKKSYCPQRLYFITGADAVLKITAWKNTAELLKLCYLVAVTRPGYNMENLKQKLTVLPPECLHKIIEVAIPAMAISSTDIRRRVRVGEPIKYLLPETVEEYIQKQQPYR